MYIILLRINIFFLYSSKKWNSTNSEVQPGTAEMLLSEIAILKNRTLEMEKECK